MPRLPPVPISPQMRLRARFWPGVIDSVATFFQSHSSSSATSWARPVRVPCPISERAMRITQVSSGLTTTQALTSAAAAVPWASAALSPSGMRIPTARPPPAAAVPTMKRRRESFMSFMSRLLPSGRHVHRLPDALIRAAAADVGHGVVDVVIGRFWLSLEESRRRHDLPGLAVTALRHVERRPSFLDGVRAGGRQAFDGDDPLRGLHAPHGKDAGADEHRRSLVLHAQMPDRGRDVADRQTDAAAVRAIGL